MIEQVPITLERPGKTEITFTSMPLREQVRLIFEEGEPLATIMPPGRVKAGYEGLVARAQQEYLIDSKRWE